MTETQTLYKTFGGLELPFKASDVDSDNLTFAPLDPAQDQLLALFEAAINAELGASWSTVVATLPTTPANFDSANPVAFTLPMEPDLETLRELKASWPLLALHREGEGTYSQESLEDSC